MRARKITSIGAAALLLLAACSAEPDGGASPATEAEKATATETAETTVEAVETPPVAPDETDPETGLTECRAELEQVIVNPETVDFGNDETYTESMGRWRATSSATSVNKSGESVTYTWWCNLSWNEGSWGATAGVPDEISVEKMREDSPGTARSACYDKVSERLVSPRDAEFEFNGGTNRDDEIILVGTVDAQNRAGVFIRHDWTCEVVWSAGFERWTVLDITLSD